LAQLKLQLIKIKSDSFFNRTYSERPQSLVLGQMRASQPSALVHDPNELLDGRLGRPLHDGRGRRRRVRRRELGQVHLHTGQVAGARPATGHWKLEEKIPKKINDFILHFFWFLNNL
jgi:hypothetical protein